MINTSTTGKVHVRRIAIVGAGFAGLALANFLEKEKKHSRKEDDTLEVDYQIFDSKSTPIQICGPISLPNGRRVLSKLGLYLQEKDTREGAEEAALVVEREEFMDLLRFEIQKKINYSCEIISVIKRHDNQYLLHTKNDKELLGPFDLVVAADGLFGLTSNCPNEIPVVIGDARWQREMWFWDFGRRRRQRGADIAICDAIELGEIILGNQGFSDKFSPLSTPRAWGLLRGGLFLAPLIMAISLQLVLRLVKDINDDD